MAGEVLEITRIHNREDLASDISNRYRELNNSRRGWLDQKRELRNYIFATDTSTTSPSTLPWTNKTTIPKICQIRDNLHANYMSAMFPNDDWLKWEAYTEDSVVKAKRETIEFYMANKLRRSDFRETISQLLYDYIDYGIVFADAEYIKRYSKDEEDQDVISYQGPRAVRRSPLDVVFNPIAATWADSPYIIRIVKTLGELERDVKRYSGYKAQIAKAALQKAKSMRANLAAFSSSDVDKAVPISVDGFGSYSTYLQQDYVEILEFHGDIHFQGEFKENYVIAVLDQSYVLYDEPDRSFHGEKPLVFGGWRYRPDSLYYMGPLDNLIGMQYRIDHLENLRADMFDLIAMPPLKIKGVVQEFDWAPFTQIDVGDDGDVEVLQIPPIALQAETQIGLLEQRMEEYAGAPRQSIGIRTPGEKTAFEVSVLEQNSNKLFQEKVQSFEVNILEPLLNRMLALARENLDDADVVSVMDDEFAVQEFKSITRADLVAEGKLRPIGARHFLKRNLAVQNYLGFRQTFGQDPAVMNHISGVAEAKMFEDLLGMEEYSLVRENIRVEEALESQRQMQAAMQSLQQEAATPADEDEAEAQRAVGGADASQGGL